MGIEDEAISVKEEPSPELDIDPLITSQETSAKKRTIVDSQDVFSCDMCEYSVGTMSSLYRHKKSKHEVIKYPCDQCHFITKSLTNLKNHKGRKHAGVQYPCDKCKYLAYSLPNLEQHRESRHFKFLCDLCPKALVFKTLDKLREHIHLVHSSKGNSIDKRVKGRTVAIVEQSEQNKEGKAVDFSTENSLGYLGQVIYIQNLCPFSLLISLEFFLLSCRVYQLVLMNSRI